MHKPVLPPDEHKRLAALRALGVLDSGPEERFDRLTRLARRIFQVPIALVSLVDENRQWFKSCDGLATSETPRDISFCGHAILGDGVFVIADTLQDSRFSDNPLVTGDPHIRFYAGCPLKAQDRHRLGTLCIIDHRPRTLDPGEMQALKDLAAIVEAELAATRLAVVDELTQVLNRRGLLMLGQYSLHICARQDQPAALAFFDLDGFKPINDRFGHAEGDRALVRFADTLRDLCRKSDLVARVGGDEFVVLLTNASSADAETFASRVTAALRAARNRGAQGYTLNFSPGIAIFDPASPVSLRELMATGDNAMYAAKQAKRR